MNQNFQLQCLQWDAAINMCKGLYDLHVKSTSSNNPTSSEALGCARLVNISNLTVAYNLLKLPKALPSKIDQVHCTFDMVQAHWHCTLVACAFISLLLPLTHMTCQVGQT